MTKWSSAAEKLRRERVQAAFTAVKHCRERLDYIARQLESEDATIPSPVLTLGLMERAGGVCHAIGQLAGVSMVQVPPDEPECPCQEQEESCADNH